jgi:hypothetical protein
MAAGDPHPFFLLLYKHIGKEALKDNLMFQLQIYFAIHPLHPTIKANAKILPADKKKKLADNMIRFRKYIGKLPSFLGWVKSTWVYLSRSTL